MDGAASTYKTRLATRRWLGLVLGCVWLLPITAMSADVPALAAKRDFWTAEDLYTDFLAEFGESADTCYSDYRLHAGPPLPDAPQTLGQRWDQAVIAIDASGSMRGRAGGKRKLATVKTATRAFLQTVPSDVEVGLLAFGHRGSNDERDKAMSCAAVEMLSDPARVDEPKLDKALDGLQAKGWTPLAAAITQAGAAFKPETDKKKRHRAVFVVSDGLETCDGDPIAAAQALRNSNVKAVVNIIGFDVSKKDRHTLEQVAHAGGGVYVHAANQRELEKHLRVRYTNPEKKAAYETAALQVKDENTQQALHASNHANTCVSNIISRESAQFLDMTHRMIEDGQTDAQSARDAYNELKVHHDDLHADMQAFRDQAKAELAEMNARIDADRARVNAAYSDHSH